ncbi:MAG: DUF3598 family protein, partial [Rivularia sp. ALOHA_DT_140]|nr:DUF3598 family protein [Rivularia sp. ALOHA_DT_140]
AGLLKSAFLKPLYFKKRYQMASIEYSSVGRGLMFFENGAFCQATMQLAPFSQFGAECSFIHENHRLRLVQLFNNLKLDKFVLIREHLSNTQPVQRPILTVDALLGQWIGEAVTIYPDLQEPQSYSTQMHLQLDSQGKLNQSLSFANHTITSTATIKDSLLVFEDNQVQVLLLPDGASVTSPLQPKLGKPLFLEVGWLINPNLRQRMICNYSDKGEWVSLTLVTENKN